MKKVFYALVILVILLVRVVSLSNHKFSNDSFFQSSCENTTTMVDLTKYTTRGWRGYNNSNYCFKYQLEKASPIISKNNRNNFYPKNSSDYQHFYGELYAYLAQESLPYLTVITDSLQKVKEQLQLSRNDFASYVVSLVQNINYVYVLPQRDGCITKKDRIEPCIDNVKFGLFSPVEFLYHLQGDCDTRTVLLYTLLKRLGYDPKIVVSMEYAHSMLLVDINTPGDYLTQNGRKYYFWETTNTGWLPGVLPPDFSNKDYWNIVL